MLFAPIILIVLLQFTLTFPVHCKQCQIYRQYHNLTAQLDPSTGTLICAAEG